MHKETRLTDHPPCALKAFAFNQHFEQAFASNKCLHAKPVRSTWSVLALHTQALLVVNDLPDIAACFEQQQQLQPQQKSKASKDGSSNSQTSPINGGVTSGRPSTSGIKGAAPEAAPGSGSAPGRGAGVTPDPAAMAAAAALGLGATTDSEASGTQPKSEPDAVPASAPTSGPSPRLDTPCTDPAPAPERLEFLVPPPPHVTESPAPMFKALGIGKLSACISTRWGPVVWCCSPSVDGVGGMAV